MLYLVLTARSASSLLADSDEATVPENTARARREQKGARGVSKHAKLSRGVSGTPFRNRHSCPHSRARCVAQPHAPPRTSRIRGAHARGSARPRNKLQQHTHGGTDAYRSP